MSQKHLRSALLLLSLMLLLTVTSPAFAGNNDITHEELAATDREHTYTTAEAVARGQRAAERYWLNTYTIQAVAAAEREFTYTTAEAVEEGRVAAEAYWRCRQVSSSRQLAESCTPEFDLPSGG